MSDFETQSSVADARKYASDATYDIQKLSEDSVERAALHNLLNAVEALIQAVDKD